MSKWILALALTQLSLAQPVTVTTEPTYGGPPNPKLAPPALSRYRLKDIARLAGMNTHSLTGYGLVAGLANSGDTQGALSSPLVLNLLNHLGMQSNPVITNGMNKNVAVVAITAEMPPFCRSGDRIDVRVSSLGDAKDLQGGTLLSSILKGPDGKIYASAQGPVSSLNPTKPLAGTKPSIVGSVLQGATLSSNLESPALARSKVSWELFQPDLATATRVAAALTGLGCLARVVGPSTVEVDLSGMVDPMTFLASCGETEITADRPARIICDERTGSVVAGAEVRLLPTVISHRGMTLEVSPQGTTLKAVVESLQKAGATPADVIGIVQTLHKVGALSGELIIK